MVLQLSNEMYVQMSSFNLQQVLHTNNKYFMQIIYEGQHHMWLLLSLSMLVAIHGLSMASQLWWGDQVKNVYQVQLVKKKQTHMIEEQLYCVVHNWSCSRTYSSQLINNNNHNNTCHFAVVLLVLLNFASNTLRIPQTVFPSILAP